MPGPNRHEASRIVRPTPSRSPIRLAVSADGQRAEVADRERDPDRARGQVELADGVDEQDREDDLAEEVRERRHRHHRPLIGMPEDVAEALTELGPERPALRARRRLLLLADPEEQHRGDRIADRVDEHGDRGGEQCDEAAGHARPGDRSRPHG